MKKGILVIGSLNMDLSIDLAKMPVTGETILGRGIAYKTGGKGANQACAAGKLGGRVRMLGCVGQDEFGQKLVKSLSESGVETNYIKESRDLPTGTAVIYVDDNGDNSIVVIPGANMACDVEYLKEQDEQFHWCDYVVLQMEIPYEAVWYSVKRAKELGKTVILNPAPAPAEIPKEVFALVDYITPNETEIAALNGKSIEDVKEGAENLLDQGVGNVLVTLGERGALLVNRNGETFYPARKVTSVDTTAAGDCFNGAMVAALAEGQNESEAILFANIASSIAVTRKGAQESLPIREEVAVIM
ncbi:ribokinase [Hungatella hathewayi]|uniref:ribokinase n=1 Tax=Hungatella hathewayi TaxID=154046 RepID=UPI00033D9A80|nr:ribokinase [Hungatella hathewayi]CCZ63450.1 ribokinase [Hungatella hathewayi CAG:224]